MSKQKLWTREELVLALNLYLKLPFGRMHSRTPEIIKLAKLIDRSANAVAMRLSNFASVDAFHMERGIVGLSGGRKQVEPIWEEFIKDKDSFLFESESLLARYEKKSIEEKFPEVLIYSKHLEGKDKLREVKTRVNQNVFRQIILANYDYRCAISGINITTLLTASHIIPWSKNEKERLNPENGICLSPLYDRAFDLGLIGINADYKILLSSQVRKKVNENYFSSLFGSIKGTKISLPKKFLPKTEFLEFHLDNIFRR